MRKKGEKLELQWKILIGIILGALLGIFLNNFYGNQLDSGILYGIMTAFKYGGDIFVRLLRMLIVPLVFASIYMAVINLGDLKELGKIGLKTIFYYLATTGLAVFIGIIMVNFIHPGKGIEKEKLKKIGISMSIPKKVAVQKVGEKSAVIIILETIIKMIPKNIFSAVAKGDILQIIFFALFIALIGATFQNDPNIAIINRFFCGVDKLMQKAVIVVMEISPYCIFLIVTKIFSDLGVDVIYALSKYGLTVLLGLLVHSVLILPLLVVLLTGQNPFKLFKAVLPAILTAWSTASSAATLPMTMECLKEHGVKDKVRNFVLPLGATVNMDGTALYESVAVIFIAELLGFDLTLSAQVVIFFTATLAGIGAAAIPGAGLVTMGIVLSAVGLPLEGIGLILAIDRLLDQFRTAVNVWGDCTAAAIIDASDQKTTPEYVPE